MEINEVIHGFEVTNIREVKEIKAVAYQMVHQKTKAQLLWLKRDDDNMTYSITFKTTPTDSTGVFHILEHSVLNGSEKFPLKEPFVDLLKGSLNTFLNAITFSDKTMYPISSRNKKDFKNLLRVYTDAVFNPMCLKNENIFRQEGWHYEFKKSEEDPLIKGVVYNEMKGSYSSADQLAALELSAALFPDNCYRFSSGGDPDVIPTLTYQMFKDTHHKYYNATNARIYLDGDVDVDDVLKTLNDEFLSLMEYVENDVTITHQSPVETDLVVKEIEATSLEDKTTISKGYVVSDYNETEKNLAFGIISSYLAEDNQSLLCKAILEKQLAQDVALGLMDDVYQPYMSVELSNTNEDKLDEINKTIDEVFQKVVDEGFDSTTLNAIINKMEFASKERDFGSFPKGLVFCIESMLTWLHGGDPIDGIVADKYYASLREKVNTSYYTDLVRDYLLNNKHKATVMIKPSLTLQQERNEKMLAEMKQLKQQMSEEEVEELINFNQQFEQWQNSEDTPEVKAMLPSLKLEDIDPNPTKFDYQLHNVDGINALGYSRSTEGISYHRLSFNIDDLSLEQLQKLTIAIALIGTLETEKHSSVELSNLRKTYLGSFDVSVTYYADANVVGEYKSILAASYSCLDIYEDQALELVKEMLYETKFTNLNDIKDIIVQGKNGLEMGLINGGHSKGMTRVLAAEGELETCQEYTSGYQFYTYVKKLAEDVSQQAIDDIKAVLDNIFTTNRLTVSMLPYNEEVVKKMISIVKVAEGEIVKCNRGCLGRVKEGIEIPAKISYGCASKRIDKDVSDEKGHLLVIKQILSLDYLWNNVRAINGAYGTGCAIRNNIVAYYSYRDPNPKNAINIYNGTAQYLRECCQSEQNLLPYIIGTIGDNDRLITNKTLISYGDASYYTNSKYENRVETRKQIINTTKEDIMKLTEIFEVDKQSQNICIVGPSEVLQQCDDLITDIRKI